MFFKEILKSDFEIAPMSNVDDQAIPGVFARSGTSANRGAKAVVAA